jgi:hypothetical protein
MLCFFSGNDPITFEEAYQKDRWKKAMKEEISSIIKNNTWELTTLPEGHNEIGVKWVFKTKRNAEGEIEKHKARLVAKGYKQQYGVDYEDVFAPVARMETVRLMTSLAAQKRWKIFQMDVKSAFLNDNLEEVVYGEQPAGFVVKGEEEKVCKLKKALYGLKQAPRAWNSRIDGYLSQKRFTRCPYEHALYVKKSLQGRVMFVCLYVDILFTGDDSTMTQDFKQSMVKKFEMTDLGLMAYFLGLEVKQCSDGIFISQAKYAAEVLKKFAMEDCYPADNPVEYGIKLTKEEKGDLVNPTYYKSIVGCLRYLTCTRPDILYGVGLISIYIEKPRSSHLRQQRGSFVLLKELQAMDCFIHLRRILKLQVTVTVTGQEAWKTEKAQLDLYSLWEKQLSRGHQRNNILSYYPNVKQNILLLHRLCVSCNMAKETDGRFAAETEQDYTNLC